MTDEYFTFVYLSVISGFGVYEERTLLIQHRELLRDRAIGSSSNIFLCRKFQRKPANDLSEVTSKFK